MLAEFWLWRIVWRAASVVGSTESGKYMGLKSYSILRTELKSLKFFYDSTCLSYQRVREVLDVRNRNREIDNLLTYEGVKWSRRQKNVRKEVAKNRTETFLRELILVRVISALEIYLVDIVRDIFLVTKAPFMDKSVRIEFSQEELIANNSPTSIYSKIINRETRRLTSGGFNEFIKYYKKRFSIDLSSIEPGYKVMNEYHDRRNILVHRLGYTDESYRRKYNSSQKKVAVDPEYISGLLDDIDRFSSQVAGKVESFISEHDFDGISHKSKLVADIHFLKEKVPACLQPNFQFWADDEYVVMTDLLTETSPAEDGRTRYYFSGSDRALNHLKRKLKKEQKNLNISIIYAVDRVREERKRKSIPNHQIDAIKNELPDQPWPRGIHKEVARKLGLSNGLVSAAIDILITRGIFKDQIDGEIV